MAKFTPVLLSASLILLSLHAAAGNTYEAETAATLPSVVNCTANSSNQLRCDFGQAAVYFSDEISLPSMKSGTYQFKLTKAEVTDDQGEKLKGPIRCTYTSGANSFTLLTAYTNPSLNSEMIQAETSDPNWKLRYVKGSVIYECQPKSAKQTCPITALPVSQTQANVTYGFSLQLQNQTGPGAGGYGVSAYAISSSDSKNWTSQNFAYAHVPSTNPNPVNISYSDSVSGEFGEQTAKYSLRLHLDAHCESTTLPGTIGNVQDIIVSVDNTDGSVTLSRSSFICGNQKLNVTEVGEDCLITGPGVCTLTVSKATANDS